MARVTAMAVRDYMAEVSRFRGRIMGFAILCILFFHSGVHVAEPWNYFFNLLWGVDIFFFCTGMGVFRSLSRDGDAVSFYVRRFRRIYPAYLPAVLVFFIPAFIRAVQGGAVPKAVQELLGNIFMLGWINRMDNQLNWYPQVICFFYLAAPALFAAVRRISGNGKRLAAFFGFFLLTQVCFFNSHFLIAYSRLSYFLMGLIAADLAERGATVKLSVPVMLVCFVAGNALMYYGQRFPTDILWGYGLSWYPGLLIVPGALFLLCRVFSLCGRVKALNWVNRLFDLLGKYSFEIFLVHLLLFGYVNELGISVPGNLAWLALIAVSVPLSIGYGKLIEKLKARVQIK